MQLTDRQQQILDFIREEKQLHGSTPSTREIQHRFGFSSQTTVMDHLRALKTKGAIEQVKNKRRSLTLPGFTPQEPTVDIPIFGAIPAGMPADQQQEADGHLTMALDSLNLPRNSRVFALKVRGNSMINAGIHDGDLVILKHKEPRDRDIVAALIDGETTLKRYIMKRAQPFLQAENPDYPDLVPAWELVIQGVMIALIRLVK